MPLKLDGFTPEALADLEALGAHMGKEDQPIFENLLQKNPKAARELVDGRLRQSDYDKKMNTSKAEVATAKKLADDMQEWYDRNKPLHDKALQDLTAKDTEYKTLKESYEKQAREYAELAASKGGDVNAAELEQAIRGQVEAHAKKFGYVTQDEFNKIQADELMKQAEAKADERIKAAETKLYTETVPALWQSAMDMAEIATDHQREFGEKLDRKAFSDYMSENKQTDPNKGYSGFVSERRGQIQLEKKIEEGVKQRLSGMQVTGNGNGSQGYEAGPMERGVLQTKIDDANKGAASTSAAAMAAAQELRSEGKF